MPLLNVSSALYRERCKRQELLCISKHKCHKVFKEFFFSIFLIWTFYCINCRTEGYYIKTVTKHSMNRNVLVFLISFFLCMYSLRLSTLVSRPHKQLKNAQRKMLNVIFSDSLLKNMIFFTLFIPVILIWCKGLSFSTNYCFTADLPIHCVWVYFTLRLLQCRFHWRTKQSQLRFS